MSFKKIVQYVHRLNATEIGLKGTNDSYLSVSKEIRSELSAIFPTGIKVDVEDIRSGKIRKFKIEVQFFSCTFY